IGRTDARRGRPWPGCLPCRRWRPARTSWCCGIAARSSTRSPRARRMPARISVVGSSHTSSRLSIQPHAPAYSRVSLQSQREAIAKAPADGYTLYYFDSGPLTVAPHVGKVGYNYLTSFTQLGHVCGSGSLLVVHPSTPFHSVSDVIELSKREPNKWSYGTSGVGGPHHLSGEYFKSVTGANLLHVPYKGGGPAMTDLMGGQIPMLFSSLGPAVGAVKSGKIRALAVTSPTRSAAFPDGPP